MKNSAFFTPPKTTTRFINPEGQITFDRTADLRRTLADMSRIRTPVGEATPYTLKQALTHTFVEGGWRNGFRMEPDRGMKDRRDADKVEFRLLVREGRYIRVTVEWER